MKKRILYSGALFIGLVSVQSGFAQKKKSKTPQRPNIVFILADDLGYGDLSCYGQEKFDTPNIDQLAQNGMRFTQCYSGTTVSAPSRSCLLTGTHSGHTAIRGNKELDPEGQFPLPADARTIFHLFKDAGYKTAAFGKWGLGFIGSTGDPNKQGIDYFYGYNCQLLAHSYYPDHLWENDQRIELKDNVLEVEYGKGTYSQDLIHSKALSFLDARKQEEPFFLFYPTIIPHAELIVPEDSIIKKFRGKFPEVPYKGFEPGSPAFRKGGYCTQLNPRATFAAMIYRLDVYVGQLVQKLKEKGMYDDAVICFTADHGDMLGDHYHWRKTYPYEGSAHIPYIVKWPSYVEKSVPAGTKIEQPVELRDFLPTFIDLAGGAVPPDMDGSSLLKLVQGHGNEWRKYIDMEHATCYSADNYWCALTDGKLKYVWNFHNGKEQLFDLVKDPGELVDCSANSKYGKQLKELREEMVKHLSERGDEFVKDGKLMTLEKTVLYSPNFPQK